MSSKTPSFLQFFTPPFLHSFIPSLLHSFSSQGLHLLHSPFVYAFATEVLPHRRSGVGGRIADLRRKLKASDEVLQWEDLGAGSARQGPGQKRMRLGQIAARSGCPPKKGELLHRICLHYQPRSCLELGTNLGISTLYQYSAVPEARFITVEGASEIAAIAQGLFAEFDLQPEQIVGEFSAVLDELDLARLQPDYVYVDGNHRYEPTLEYFQRLLPFMKAGGLMVFDDIYWSAGMRKAWEEIIAHPEVTVSIDLFRIGLCFIRRPQAKEHFKLRI